MGGANAGYDCIAVFSETDFAEDLKAIDLPVLVMHCKDDQVVPYDDAGPLPAMLLRNGILKTYGDNIPHRMMTTHRDIMNRGSAGLHPGIKPPTNAPMAPIGESPITWLGRARLDCPDRVRVRLKQARMACAERAPTAMAAVAKASDLKITNLAQRMIV
jgi:hypothetical protein